MLGSSTHTPHMLILQSSHSTATRPRENFSHISRGGALTPLDGRVEPSRSASSAARRNEICVRPQVVQRGRRAPVRPWEYAQVAEGRIRAGRVRDDLEERTVQLERKVVSLSGTGGGAGGGVSPCGIAVVAGSDRQPGRG